jgi:hypothetical protein
MFSGLWALKPVNLIVWITVPAVILWLLYFYPPCIFYRLTGFFCPGCGSRRAVSSVFEGNLLQAAGYNLLLMAVVAERLIYFILAGFSGGKLQWPTAWYYRMFFISAICFGIMRNLPLVPFVWLAP